MAYVLQYFHALAKKYLLLFPTQTKLLELQSYMARSTSDGARPNVDYRKSKLFLSLIHI